LILNFSRPGTDDLSVMSLMSVKNLADRLQRALNLRSVVAVSTTPDAARLGRWLVLFGAVVIAATGWYVDINKTDRFAHWNVGVVGAMLLLAGATRRLPWHRMHRRWVLLYPLAAFTLLAAVGVMAPAAGPGYLSMFTLWFLYIGVTQKAGTSWLVAPFGALAWIVISWPIDEQRVVRLCLVLLVWGVLGDVLAMRARQVDERTHDLSQQAETDALTGLANRRALQRELDAMTAGDIVVVLDIDHFKRVNDTRGHDGGDRVLVDLAGALSSVIRAGDVVARLGGEEFVLLLRHPVRTSASGQSAPVAQRCAEAVLERLRVTWSALYPDITWSAGVCGHLAGTSPTQTLSHADAALYEAKRAGRDRVVVHEPRVPTSEPVYAI
jgi:diguanylate cyclase (GGDEF)-like protein